MTTIHLVSEFEETTKDFLKVVTHDGVFHADDVIAVSIISMVAGSPVQLVRTRNPGLIAQADVVIDVGGVYDASAGRFDHHQTRGGVVSVRHVFSGCASAGLIWDHYGDSIVLSHFSGVPSILDGLDIDNIVKEVHAAFISDVDSIDVGNRRPSPGEYSFSHAVASLNPAGGGNHDAAFLVAVEWVKPIIGAEINKAVARLKDRMDADKVFADSERVAVFPRYLEGWQDIVPERIQRVVFPRLGGGWSVQRPEGRVDLPTQDEARSLLGEDLVFIHANRFIGAAKTQSGAITLAHYGL